MAFKSFVGGKVTTSETTIKKVTGKQIDYYVSQNASSRIQDPYLEFKYYAYGALMGTTYFYFHPDGGSLTQLTNISANNSTYSVFSGQQQTATGQAWRTATINLSSFEGSPGKIVIRHQSQTASSFFEGDFQMDNIKINCANGQIVDLDPDLKRTDDIDNWQKGQLSTEYGSSSWTNVSFEESSTSFWCYDNNGTGSSNTGDTVDSDGSSTGYYLYTEVSGTGGSYNHVRTINSYDLFSGAVVV